SLGRLLEIGQQLAAIQRGDRPVARPILIVVFAADHGVAKVGVSAYPQEVTGQMVGNFLAGGAAINVMAGVAKAQVPVVDIGVAHPVVETERIRGYVSCPIRAGTANFLDGPAMSRAEAYRAVELGLGVVSSSEARSERVDYRVVALGEMGIGNST